MKAATFCLLRMAFSQTGAHVMYKHHMNTALYQAFLRRLSVLKTPDMRGFRKESVRNWPQIQIGTAGPARIIVESQSAQPVIPLAVRV